MHTGSVLSDLAVIFAVAVAVVLALGRAGLPPVVGFLVAGILVGPGGLGLVGDVHRVELLAEYGVALLLFTIGLEFSLERLTRIGRYVAVGGGLQVLLSIAGGVVAALIFGRGVGQGVFWGYLAALSSTAIVLRALADREETAAPHGRFVVGVLIFQDLCIVPMMLTLPMLAGSEGGFDGIVRTLGTAIAVVALTLGGARVVVPRVLHAVAATRRRELFVLSVLLVAISVASLTAWAGLSLALGAFLAGVLVADTEFVHQATSDVAPFRDALASLFFVSVGMLLDPMVAVDLPGRLVVVFTVLLLGKLVLATLAGLLMRFPARVAMLAGIALAQVGEFSFVLMRSGQELRLISADGARVFLAASVLTMITTPLLLSLSPRIAAGAALLRPLERLLGARPVAEERAPEPLRDHVIIAGLGLGGQLLMLALEAVKVPYVALELNPETVARERLAHRPVRYGDVSSVEVLDHVAEAGHAKLLVLMLSDAEAARRAAANAKARFPNLHILVRTHRTARDQADVERLGVEVVSEDYETALEIVERVLRRSGADMGVIVEALGALRRGREHGKNEVPADALLRSIAVDALRLPAGHPVEGHTVSECGLRAVTGALIVAISREGRVTTAPSPDHRMVDGDILFVVGTPAQLAHAREWWEGR
jgi:CPA2 family monovalent cation:H+ antiporter-2